MIYDHPLIDKVYRNSPLFLQHTWVSAYGLLKLRERWGTAFRSYVRELDASQWWSSAELKELQDSRLRALVEHAYANVPYYRRIMTEHRLVPADIRSAEDLYKLPVLTKEGIRTHRGELRATNVTESAVTTGRTGGTTGIPLHFALDRKRVIFDHALIHRHWSWAGYRPGARVLVFRGLTLVPPDTSSGVYWRRDWVDNRIYLSSFHLAADVMPLFIEKLQQWRPQYISAYPSSLFTLARFMEKTGHRIPVRAVFTSSEVLTPTERRIIEKQFCCSVWDRYGTGERLVVGQQCEQGNYHQNVEYGVLQIDAPRGTPATVGTKGELIQTSLTNFSMPLIRYASEDLGFLVPTKCPCGRSLPLMGPVEGRKDDVIVTAEGRPMPRAGLDQIHEFVENMERCQLVQEKLGEVIVRVLPRPGFSDADRAELRKQLRKRIGDGTEILIDLVSELPLTVTGKERFIVSKLDLEGLSFHTEIGPEQ